MIDRVVMLFRGRGDSPRPCFTINRRAAIACWESTDNPSKPTSESSPSEKIAFDT
jgi:hypothetical protein